VVGYRAAAEALLRLIRPKDGLEIKKNDSLNFLGEYNLGGEKWIVERYLREIGIKVNVAFTGDSSVEALKKAPEACLNIVQCTGSMHWLASQLEKEFGTPCLDVNFFGSENIATSLRNIAQFYGDDEISRRTEALIERESAALKPKLEQYRSKLQGKRAAIYVGGAFKAMAITRQLKELGVEVVVVGTQTGRPEEYETLSGMLDDGTVIIDDANPAELERFLLEKHIDVMAGGVKERTLAFKLGIGFIDHNHDRKDALAGYEGALRFAREVYITACSPVWKHLKALSAGGD
jgi:nitrogenase molybdenum-cofactor synthesis protein NifE